MRNRTIGFVASLSILLLATCGTRLQGQQITPEEAQRQVTERAKQIEQRETERKRLEEFEKQDTPAMKQARREFQKEYDDSKKSRERSNRAFLNADVQGCEPRTVWVSPKVGNDRGLKRSYLYSTMSMTIINRSSESVDIVSDLHRTLITNLCSGGRATLRFSPTPSDGMSIQFTLTAISTSTNGVKTDTRSISLYKGYGSYSYDYRQVFGQLWEVRPQ